MVVFPLLHWLVLLQKMWNYFSQLFKAFLYKDAELTLCFS